MFFPPLFTSHQLDLWKLYICNFLVWASLLLIELGSHMVSICLKPIIAQKSFFSLSPLFPSCLKPFVQQALCLHTVESEWCYHRAWWKERCYLLGFSFLYQRCNLGSCCTAALCLFSFYPLKYLYRLTCIAVCKGSPFEGTKASWSGQGEVLFFVVRHQYFLWKWSWQYRVFHFM